MTSKLTKQVTYTLDIDLPALDIKKTFDLTEQQLAEACRQIETLYTLLKETRGTFTLPRPARNYKSNLESVLQYARSHDDFTVKQATTDLGIPDGTIYGIVAKLSPPQGKILTVKREGVTNIYRVASKIEVAKPDPNLISKFSPERERMDSR